MLTEPRDSIEKANQCMTEAIASIRRWQVPADPVNFTVAYELAKGENKALSSAALRHIKQKKRVDNYCLEQWYQVYVVNSAGTQRELISGVERIIRNLQTLFVGADVSLEEYISKLDESMSELSSEDDADLSSVLRSVLKATTDVKGTQTDLRGQLKDSESETESLKKELAKAQQQAVTDQLTGLCNRRGLDAFVAEQIKDNGASLNMCAIIVDIDHFKRFNDNYGHLIGDVVLAKVAEQLSKFASDHALAFRYGGEEFVVLLKGATLALAKQYAEGMRKAIEAMKLINGKTHERLPRITVSLGVAKSRAQESFEQFIQRADAALYEAKEEGRNQVRIGL